jgi:hypothetical protein
MLGIYLAACYYIIIFVCFLCSYRFGAILVRKVKEVVIHFRWAREVHDDQGQHVVQACGREGLVTLKFHKVLRYGTKPFMLGVSEKAKFVMAHDDYYPCAGNICDVYNVDV